MAKQVRVRNGKYLADERGAPLLTEPDECCCAEPPPGTTPGCCAAPTAFLVQANVIERGSTFDIDHSGAFQLTQITESTWQSPVIVRFSRQYVWRATCQCTVVPPITCSWSITLQQALGFPPTFGPIALWRQPAFIDAPVCPPRSGWAFIPGARTFDPAEVTVA